MLLITHVSIKPLNRIVYAYTNYDLTFMMLNMYILSVTVICKTYRFANGIYYIMQEMSLNVLCFTILKASLSAAGIGACM